MPRPPSIDSKVAFPSILVSACTMCATHSALVERAYWRGWVAPSARSANCLAMVRATNLLNTSPTTMPLTPPSGFCSAVILPTLTTVRMSSRIRPRAKSVATSPNKEDPGHYPAKSSNAPWSCQTVLLPHLSEGLWGPLPPRMGQEVLSHLAVVNASVPGAKESPSRAWRAFDNSHKTQCPSRPRLDGVLLALTPCAFCCCSRDGSFERCL